MANKEKSRWGRLYDKVLGFLDWIPFFNERKLIREALEEIRTAIMHSGIRLQYPKEILDSLGITSEEIIKVYEHLTKGETPMIDDAQRRLVRLKMQGKRRFVNYTLDFFVTAVFIRGYEKDGGNGRLKTMVLDMPPLDHGPSIIGFTANAEYGAQKRVWIASVLDVLSSKASELPDIRQQLEALETEHIRRMEEYGGKLEEWKDTEWHDESCSSCEGTGKIHYMQLSSPQEEGDVPCESCHGTGTIPAYKIRSKNMPLPPDSNFVEKQGEKLFAEFRARARPLLGELQKMDSRLLEPTKYAQVFLTIRSR